MTDKDSSPQRTSNSSATMKMVAVAAVAAVSAQNPFAFSQSDALDVNYLRRRSSSATKVHSAFVSSFFNNPWSAVLPISPVKDKVTAFDAFQSIKDANSLQSTDTLFEDELASVTRSRNPSIKSKPKTSMISSNKDNFTELDTHNNPPAVSKDDMEELILPDTSEPITLYQGFRAIHPRLFKHAIKAKIHQSNLPSPYSSPLTITNTPKSSSTELATRPESKEKLKVTSVNIPSSPHFTNLPVKARHQASAIHNITRIFSDLLNERDLLLFEADELDSKRSGLEDELRFVEEQLSQLSARKSQIIASIKPLVEREEAIANLVSCLDERINAIGDHTIRVEKTIRTIKGDSALMLENIDHVFHQSSSSPYLAAHKPALNSNECVKTLFGHEDIVECLDFENPHGLAVSGSADKTVRVWDLSNYQSVGVLKAHTGWVRSIQISGYHVMTGSGDHTIKHWDISNIQDSQTHQPAQNTLQNKRASPFSPLFYRNSRLDCLDDKESCLLHTFEGHDGGVTCIMFDSNYLLSGSSDKTMRQWDLETGETISVLRTEAFVESLDSPLGQLMHGDPRSSTMESMNTSFANLLSHPEFQGWSESQTYVPNTISASSSSKSLSKLLNTGGHVGSLYVWQYALASGYGDGVVRLWDLRTGQCHRELKGHYGAVTTVSFNDRYVFSGSIDKSVKIWDLRGGHVVQHIEIDGCVSNIHYDSGNISISGGTRDVKVFNLANSSTRSLHGHTKPSRAIRHVGNNLISGGMDMTIRIWSL